MTIGRWESFTWRGVECIEEAFLYGSYARGDERATSEGDPFVASVLDGQWVPLIGQDS